MVLVTQTLLSVSMGPGGRPKLMKARVAVWRTLQRAGGHFSARAFRLSFVRLSTLPRQSCRRSERSSLLLGLSTLPRRNSCRRNVGQASSPVVSQRGFRRCRAVIPGRAS